MRTPIALALLLGCSPTDLASDDLLLAGGDGAVQAQFSPGGARITDDSATWRVDLQFTGWGRERAITPVGNVKPVQAGARVIYDHGAVQEWYESRADGIKQGFDVSKQPDGRGPLVLEMNVRAGLIPVLRHDSQAIHFIDEAGRIVLGYDELAVYDATGAELESWMGLACERVCSISLHVDDAGAVYPIEVDPRVYANVTVFDKPFNGNPGNENFGFSIAVDGNTAVVGDPLYGNNNNRRGAAHIYTRSGATWSKQADLFGTVDGTRFGHAVAIDGGTILVGAPGAGTATVYTGSGATWTQQQVLSSTAPGFGTSVAVDGDRALIGAPQATNGGTDRGRLLTSVRTGTTWSALTVLPDPGTATNGDALGTWVALDGNTAAAGMPGVDGSVSNIGAVAIYTVSGTTWTFQTRLLASDPSANAVLGTSVALLGDTLIAGAPGAGAGTGAAYVFTGSGASWAQQQKLTPTSANPTPVGGNFGARVALQVDQAVVGAPEHNSNTRGAAYTFYRQGTNWSQDGMLQTGNSQGQREGSAVGISGTDVLTGAPFGASKGNLYIYRVQNDADGDGWTACANTTPPCDCNDNDPLVNPSRPEIEGNAVDEDCDGLLAVCGTAPKAGCDVSLAITEVFSSPVSGLEAERWFEIQNLSAHRVDMRFANLLAERNQGEATIAAQLTTNRVIEPGGLAVFAGSANPAANGGISGATAYTTGFTLFPDLDLFAVRRASTLGFLDTVAFTNGFSTGADRPVGASLSVDPAYAHPDDNDIATRWCDGRSTYGNGAFGTPGVANDPCSYSLCFDFTYSDPVSSTAAPFIGNFTPSNFCSGPTLASCVRGAPISVTFDFCENADACGPFGNDRYFTTSNEGEGSVLRTTTAAGQDLAFSYRYFNGDPGPTYFATRAFGAAVPVAAGIDLSLTTFPYQTGDWSLRPLTDCAPIP